MAFYLKPLNVLVISPHIEYSKIRLHTGLKPRPEVTIFEKYKDAEIITIHNFQKRYKCDIIIDEIAENTFLTKNNTIIKIRSEAYYGRLFTTALKIKSCTSIKNYIMKYNNDWYIKLCTNFKEFSVKDHLGKNFANYTKLAKHYDCDIKKLRHKLNKGLSIKDAIVQSKEIKVIKDHKGNSYNSKSEMCKHYGLTLNTLIRREHKHPNWTLEKLLTTKPRERKHSIQEITYKGVTYSSSTAFCKAINISYTKYKRGIKLGKTLEQIIKENDSKRKVSDHLGKNYDEIQKLCEEYNIPRHIYSQRLKRGWDLEKTLTTPIEPRKERRKTNV